MAQVKEGVLLSREEARAMELREELIKTFAPIVDELRRCQAGVQDDFSHLTIGDVPRWFRWLNYAAIVGLVAWVSMELLC